MVAKVIKWRKIYDDGKQLSLEEAAQLVGMSKKSLDDYLLQLKNARKFGFNFNEHKEDKIGLLRAFNRKFRPFCAKGKPGRKPKKVLMQIETQSQSQSDDLQTLSPLF